MIPGLRSGWDSHSSFCSCTLNETWLVPLEVPPELSAVGLSGWYQDGQVHETLEGGAGPGWMLLRTQSNHHEEY